jgi:protocatechuate 3,4-dioxygenase beta subunit
MTREVQPFRAPSDGADAPIACAAYQSNRLRAPQQPLILLPQSLSETTGPVFGDAPIRPGFDDDLTRQHAEEPIGQRIIVAGRVCDADNRPAPRTLVEIWQANAGGRYAHDRDRWASPLDRNFTGAGRVVTADDGSYRFVTIRPGAYPWRNHDNAWRPPHVHFSLFGPAFATRLVTQMYFEDDPLLALDPIYQSIPNERARRRLLATFDLEHTVPEWALGYRFDIVLRGRGSTPMERRP